MKEKPYRAEVCNICGSDRYRRVHFFKEWNLGREPVRDVSIVQCRSCRVRRRMPGIIDDYEAEYHAPYEEQGQAIHPHQLCHFADLMTVRLPQFDAKNVKFLDVGCSTGRVLRLATTLGFEATGLDYSRWATEYCAKLGFTTRHGSLIGQWEESTLFDIIHCCHTIEHLPDPVAYLQEMHRLLKPGGQLMLACPNYASLPRLILRDKWGVWCLDSHLWQFTSKQMQRLLAANGFEVVSVSTHHGFCPQKRWKRWIKKWIFDPGAALGYADGLNIIAVRL
jgi:2-polyprenyl-3-methyl-5-hydroxy-6-metoxy-1,4-benzoquinol methylase